MAERELRLEEELSLIASVFQGVTRSGDWFLIEDDSRARRHGWTPTPFPVALQAQRGHPGQVPYGIYIPSSARVGGHEPNNFSATASNQPPFAGQWGVLSWQGDADGKPWIASANIREGANLLNFLLTFEERYKQGV